MNKDLLRLKQLIFRATRGNALIINKNEDKVRGFNKNVFFCKICFYYHLSGRKFIKKIRLKQLLLTSPKISLRFQKGI